VSTATLLEELPDPATYNRLRKAVGWGGYGEALIAEALPCSLYCVCAHMDGRIVGMARVIGDGGLVYYIQDVIVEPGLQGQGLGTQLMERVMAYLCSHAEESAIIGLMAAVGREPFYERYGFTQRPNSRLGAGMTIFWRVPSRATEGSSPAAPVSWDVID
jgi:GNAT superfamily N-acetyltransferase